jgi:small-conductance mechanosensitive channel
MHIKRFITLADRPSDANQNEQPRVVQSPFQRAITPAAGGCLISLIILVWAARPVIELLNAWWVELLAYAVLPCLIAFWILYRSDWHRDMAQLTRTGSLLLTSVIILGADFVALLIITILAALIYSTFVDGFTAIHY